MPIGSDNGDAPGGDTNDVCSEEKLSPKALEIKRQIREGSYRVDLSSLAQQLLDDGVLKTPELTPPKSEEVRNDEKPKGK